MAKKEKSKKEHDSDKGSKSAFGQKLFDFLRSITPVAFIAALFGLLLINAGSDISPEDEDVTGFDPKGQEETPTTGYTVGVNSHIRTYTPESGRKASTANHQYAEEHGIRGLLDNQSYVREHERTYTRAA